MQDATVRCGRREQTVAIVMVTRYDYIIYIAIV